MLRDLMVNESLVADATFKADVAMATGMGVQKNHADGTADFPAAETAVNIFAVQKSRIPVGIETARTEFSDWDAAFNTVAVNEIVVLYQYPAGSQFGTDAFASALTNADKGKVLSVGTDGEWKKATASTVNSAYKFLGLYTENGHTLAKIEVLDTATANS